jgi:uncharacterized SAM-binding protein YcdF (DUF218 family)
MKRIGILIGVVCIFLVFFIFRSFLLIFLANFLVIEDPLKKADIIIVLSGDLTGERVSHAVELFKKRYANKIIMIGDKIQWNTSEPEIMKKHAIHLGISEKDIMVVNQGKSTYAQAKKLLEVMKENNFKSAIVVTSNYHTKRTKYVFRKIFSPSKLTVIVLPSSSNRFNSLNWWKTSEQAEVLFHEYTKLLWYWLRY